MMNNNTGLRKGFFITGTDTEVGKTTIAVALLNELARRGLTTTALKPIAAGCVQEQDDDAWQLQQAATVKLTRSDINPVVFELPIAPVIAAALQNQTLTCAELLQQCAKVLDITADYLIVEGAGGWKQPLNQQETLVDFAKAINLPVILVVGIRLGCINHALLTVESILSDNLPLVGWVANMIDDTLSHADQVITLLQNLLTAPCLGIVPYQKHAIVVKDLDLSPLNIGRSS